MSARRLLALTPAVLAAAVLAVPAAWAAPAPVIVRPGPAIERAIGEGQTGLFVLYRAELGADGTVEGIGVVDGGRLVDLMARRAGAALPRLASTLPRRLSPQDHARLLAFGLDRPLAAEGRARFLGIVRQSSPPPPVSAARAVPGAARSGPLVFFDGGNRPFFARWGFEYQPGRHLAFSIGDLRAAWTLP